MSTKKRKNLSSDPSFCFACLSDLLGVAYLGRLVGDQSDKDDQAHQVDDSSGAAHDAHRRLWRNLFTRIKSSNPNTRRLGFQDHTHHRLALYCGEQSPVVKEGHWGCGFKTHLLLDIVEAVGRCNYLSQLRLASLHVPVQFLCVAPAQLNIVVV